MRAKDLLLDCDFGEDVADYDLQLSQYFVETSSFRDVVNDRADLILGEKGSGKSAIFRQLAHSSDSVSALRNVHVIPAFNSQGSVIFRKLADHEGLPESAFRLAWSAYLLALVANHIIEKNPRQRSTKRLAKLLQRAGLRSTDATPSGVWPKVERLLQTLTRHVEAEGDFNFEPSVVPVKIGLRAKLLHAVRPTADVDIELLFRACSDVLAEDGSRCWIIFDRLDEAFHHDPEFESVALRSLLRAHLDLVSYQGAIKSKLFLRTDILDRVTAKAGFVNATHLRRQYLTWDQESILDLIARRIVARTELARILDLDHISVRDRRGRIAICGAVLPLHVDHQSLIGWLEACTSDGRGALNPRNVITLLKQARAVQLEIYDRDDPVLVEGRPLVGIMPLQRALHRLSEVRLEDTVLAEHSHLRAAVKMLRAKPVRMSRDQLAVILGADTASTEYEVQIEQLLASGILGVGANPDTLTVPELYRHALKSNIQRYSGSDELTTEDVLALRQVADTACARVQASGTTQYIQELDNVQRDIVNDYVRGNYPDLEVSTRRMRSTGFRAVVVKVNEERRRRDGRFPVFETDGVDTVSDSELSSLRAKVVALHEQAAELAISAFSGEVPRAMEFQFQEWSYPLKRALGVGIVALLDGENGGMRLQIARDVPGATLVEQEQELANGAGDDLVRAYVSEACDAVVETGTVARVRPMGPKMLAVALTAFQSRNDVTYALTPGKRPGISRFSISAVAQVGP